MQAGRTERGWRVKNKITQVIIILCGCIVMAVAGSRPEKNEASWAAAEVVEEAADEEITDDCVLLENCKHKVKVIEGEYTNIKITTYEDLNIVKQFLN